MGTYGGDEVDAHEMADKLMMDTTKADENSLPKIYPAEFEYQLSSIFIDTDTPLVNPYVNLYVAIHLCLISCQNV